MPKMKHIEKRYVPTEDLRKRLFAMGYKDAYTMPSEHVHKIFSKPKQKKNPQTTLDSFGKAGNAAFMPVNPRTVASCKRYYEAGIAGQECKMVLSQAKQYENQVGRNLFDIDEAKLSIYSVLPKIQFGLTERNIIFIRNWYNLNAQEKQTLSSFFDNRGVAYPGKSSEFIKENLPKGRREKRMFETFNIVHGLDLEITPDGFVFIRDYSELDPDLLDLLQFYFTDEGYAKTYFQNGFMSSLGLKFREHVPSKIKTRDKLLMAFDYINKENHTAKEAREILKDKNPSIKTNIEKFDDELATDIINRYRLYTKISSFFNEEINFIGTTSYADQIFDLEEEFEEKSNVVSTTFYNKSKFGIAVSDPFSRNSRKIEAVLDEAERINWIPKNCNDLDYISAHEFAHGLIHVYDLPRDPVLRQIEMELMEKEGVVDQVSINAKLNSKEFIADCWSEYVISPTPRKTSILVGDRVLKFLQKKVIIL